MGLLVALLFVLVAVFAGSAGLIVWALLAAARRQRRIWLYAATPFALITALWTAREIALLAIGLLVAFANGGTGKS